MMIKYRQINIKEPTTWQPNIYGMLILMPVSACGSPMGYTVAKAR